MLPKPIQNISGCFWSVKIDFTFFAIFYDSFLLSAAAAESAEMEGERGRGQNQDFGILGLLNVTKILFQSKLVLGKLRRDFGGRCIDTSKKFFMMHDGTCYGFWEHVA